MKSNKRVRLILVLASISMIVILAVPSKKTSVDIATTPQPALAPGLELPSVSATLDHERLALQRIRSAQLTWGRNPFLSPGAAGASTDVAPQALTHRGDLPQLTGLSVLDGRRMAIIDHEVVQEGDLLVSGYVVKHITSGSVTLLLDEEELTLKLGAEQ